VGRVTIPDYRAHTLISREERKQLTDGGYEEEAMRQCVRLATSEQVTPHYAESPQYPGLNRLGIGGAGREHHVAADDGARKHSNQRCLGSTSASHHRA
jgi:hypothetical protein